MAERIEELINKLIIENEQLRAERDRLRDEADKGDAERADLAVVLKKENERLRAEKTKLLGVIERLTKTFALHHDECMKWSNPMKACDCGVKKRLAACYESKGE